MSERVYYVGERFDRDVRSVTVEARGSSARTVTGFLRRNGHAPLDWGGGRDDAESRRLAEAMILRAHWGDPDAEDLARSHGPTLSRDLVASLPEAGFELPEEEVRHLVALYRAHAAKRPPSPSEEGAAEPPRGFEAPPPLPRTGPPEGLKVRAPWPGGFWGQVCLVATAAGFLGLLLGLFFLPQVARAILH